MEDQEDSLLRSVALRNAESILAARRRAEEELVRAKQELERKSEELAHSLAMMRATLESTTNGILVTDGAGNVAHCNRQFIEMWRLPDDVLGTTRNHRQILKVASGQFKDPSAFLARVEEIYASPSAESTDVLELADGRVFERFSRIQSVNGRNVGRVWSFRDITDRVRLYEDLKRAAEDRKALLDAERAARGEAERVSLMKDEFLATLSHELRTPLNAILGWSQILRTRNHPNEELREALAVIERNAKVQTQLIEDLLDMSRIVSGKVRLDVQRVDLRDVVQSSVASVRHSADARGIRLQLILDPMAGPVRGDPNRLQQCFWNLLSNAIKFTPRGGRVQVSLQRVNSHVEVCVADNGLGIKPEFLPHVFERFRQADSTTTRSHGGLGLGLSIVKSLIELHGGTVRADSAGEGQGSTFCIDLPLMVVHPHEAESARKHPRGFATSSAGSMDMPSLAGITVLAVDDEPDARTLLKRVLEDCGAAVFTAASAREGLALVRIHRPDMIISDIGMPDEDGYDFIRQVRAFTPDDGGRTPAAALTAFARAEDRTRVLRAGYQAHVAKPVEPAELAAVVASLATPR